MRTSHPVSHHASHHASHRISPVAIGFAVTLLVIASCGDDDGDDAGETIENREAWCDVVRDVDERFLAADTDSADFEDMQAQYVEIQTRVRQLAASTDVVDESARDDVAAAMAWVGTLTDTIVEAEDAASLEEAVGPVFAEAPDLAAAAGWILDECGVDIDS